MRIDDPHPVAGHPSGHAAAAGRVQNGNLAGSGPTSTWATSALAYEAKAWSELALLISQE